MSYETNFNNNLLLTNLHKKSRLDTNNNRALVFYTSNRAMAWECFQIFLGVVSYGVVVWGMHTQSWSEIQSTDKLVKSIDKKEWALGAFMLLDYFVRLLFAGTIVPSFFSTLDILVIVLSFFARDKAFPILCSARIWRLLRLHELKIFFTVREHNNAGVSAHNSTRQRHRLLSVFLFLNSLLVVLLLLSATVFSLLEPDQFPSWFEGLYFAFVTISTVGYGDSYPHTQIGRQFAMVLITVTVFAVPLLLSRVFSTYSQLRHSMVGNIMPSLKSRPFVFVTGRFDVAEVAAVVEGFYSAENRSLIQKRFGAVPDIHFVQDIKPTRDIKDYLSQPMWNGRLHYKMADASKIAELKALRVSEAVGHIVVSDKTGSDHSDMRSVMYALAIIGASKKQATALQMEVHHQPYQDLARVLGVTNCVCFESLRGMLLGSELRCRGITTFFQNLLESSIRTQVGQERDPWEDEYMYGMSMDMYQLSLNRFQGMTFAAAAKELYQENGGVTLFAVQKKEDGGKLLNPGDLHVIRGDDKGYVIATDEDTVRLAEDRVNAKLPLMRRREGEGQLATAKRGASLWGTAIQQQRKQVKRASNTTTVDLHSAFRMLPSQAVASSLATSSSFCPTGSIAGVVANEHFHTASYYTLSQSERPLSDAFIADDRVVDLRNHVIISGELDSMLQVVVPLRRRLLVKSQRRDVVFVVPSLPTEAEWEPFARIPDIFVVVGSLTSPEAFVRAGIDKAFSVLVTSVRTGQEQFVGAFGTLMQSSHQFRHHWGTSGLFASWEEDATALATTVMLENLLKGRPPKKTPTLTTEVANRSSLRLISHVKPSDKAGDVGARVSPLSASGRAFSLDQIRAMLAVQLFLKPFLFNMLHLLLFGQEFHFRKQMFAQRQRSVGYDEFDVAGVDDSDSSEEGECLSGTRSVFIHERELPSLMRGRTYGELFAWCVERGQIVLALYRAQATHGSPMAYVVTNPLPATVLRSSDVLIVLGFAGENPRNSVGGNLVRASQDFTNDLPMPGVTPTTSVSTEEEHPSPRVISDAQREAHVVNNNSPMPRRCQTAKQPARLTEQFPSTENTTTSGGDEEGKVEFVLDDDEENFFAEGEEVGVRKAESPLQRLAQAGSELEEYSSTTAPSQKRHLFSGLSFKSQQSPPPPPPTARRSPEIEFVPID